MDLVPLLRSLVAVDSTSSRSNLPVLDLLEEAARKHPLALLFTADEEVGCLGAKRLLAEGRVHPRHAIVGEPTSLVPVRAHKGYCAVEVIIEGVEGHSAYPDVGASAIHAMGRLWTDIEAIGAQLRGEADASFSPPHTNWTVSYTHLTLPTTERV